MDTLNTLQTLGLDIPTPAYLIGAIVFSLIGYFAYQQGKHKGLKSTRWLGMALMLYTFVVSDTVAMYAVGLALCGTLYVWRV